MAHLGNTIVNGSLRVLGGENVDTINGVTVGSSPKFTDTRKAFACTCSSAADAAAKVVSLVDSTGWELRAGTIIGVKFTNDNSASSCTLNVNGSGAKSIWYQDAVFTGNTKWICGFASRYIYYMWDGTYWVWLNFGWHSDNNNAVTQTATTTDANYEVLFSGTADNTTRTEDTRKTTTLRFNPGRGALMQGNSTVADGSYSHAEGQTTSTSASYSHAEGGKTTASNTRAHAEGENTLASGEDSHAEGNNTRAAALGAHSEGYLTTASSNYSHAEGRETYASGQYSHAEGHQTTAFNNYSHAEGLSTSARGNYSHAEGHGTSTYGSYNHSEGEYTLAGSENVAQAHASGHSTSATNSNSASMGHYNAAMTTGGSSTNTNGTAFVIGNGTAATALKNAFSVQFDGTVKAASTITASTTADYAEYFEWYDKNPNNEDRVGYFVTFDSGDKIKIGSPEDEYILGIVSGEPFVLGNGDCDVWNGMVMRDAFRRTIYEPAPKYEYLPHGEAIPVKDKDGKPVYEGTKPKYNPNYDPTQPYINRADRPEWSAVGMLGVLAVRDNGQCQINSYCTVGQGGIAVPADINSIHKYRVIKRNATNVVEVVFR